MLLLIYVLISTYFVFFTMGYDFVMSIKWEIDTYYYSYTAHERTLLIRSTIIQFAFIMNCLIGGLMTFFLKFHIKLVGSNKTTIENLDKKGQAYKSVYDINTEYNW